MQLFRSFALLAVIGSLAFAGGLYLEIAPGAAGALLTAKVTACHEPAKSTVTAHLLTLDNGTWRRQPLRVAAVAKQPGVFAIAGDLPAASALIELAVTNPQYDRYEPRVLIRTERGQAQLPTKQYFFNKSPQPADYRQILQTTYTD